MSCQGDEVPHQPGRITTNEPPETSLNTQQTSSTFAVENTLFSANSTKPKKKKRLSQDNTTKDL